MIDFGGQRTLANDMRRAILEHLGNNNVLVGFHVAWTLTALSLLLPACRVVDLGAEEAYQLFCFKVSDAFPVWKTLFVERLTNSLDRRIPAVFCGDGIELYTKGQHDLIVKAYYTAAIWNVLEPSISAQRLRTAVYRIKCAYSLGNGYALDRDESRLLSKPRSLVDRPRNLPVASLQCDQADILSMLEVAPGPDLRWHGDHSAFLQHCTNMLREWGPRPPMCSDDVPVFGPELERCAMAVDVALPARMVSGPAKLLVPWINHHGLFTVSELRRIDPGRRELQSTEGRRLFSCFLNFGLQPAMLATALGGPPRPETPQGVVNLESPDPPAFAAGTEAGAPAAAKGAGGTPARPPTSPARRALDMNTSASTPAPTPSHQPVVVVPQVPWALTLSSQRPRQAQWRPHSTRAAAARRRRVRCRARRPEAAKPSAVLTAQQRARERALRQASRQRPRRQAPRRPTSRNDPSF